MCLLAWLSQTMSSAMTTPSSEGGASTPQQEVDGEADRFLQVFTCNMATRREVSHVKFRRDFSQKSVKCPRLWNSIICRKQYSERFSRHFVITRLWKSARKDLVIQSTIALHPQGESSRRRGRLVAERLKKNCHENQEPWVRVSAPTYLLLTPVYKPVVLSGYFGYLHLFLYVCAHA